MNPGQQVTSTLRLSRLLGQGGMGSVWIADHLALGTQVAVKFMSPAFAQHAGFVERFRREAMAAAQIKSPHIAQVFDHGVTAEGSSYIVMELLEGEDLKQRIERRGPLPPAEVARILAQAAKALGRAHQLGIVHRDMKPDNVFLLDIDGEPFVKVLDFGVAKYVLDGDLAMTSTGNMMGTPLYMSPEQLLSAKHVDLRADLWGLGVIAYFALTGKVPFSGETLGALSVAVNAGVFAPPGAVREGLSPAIDAWMQKALERDPAARFASAKELADAFEVAAGVSVSAPPSSVSQSIVADAPASRAIPRYPASGGSNRTPSGAVLSGSGVQERTSTPMVTSDSEGARGRSFPAVVVSAVLGLVAIGVVLLLVRRSQSSGEPVGAAPQAPLDTALIERAERPVTPTPPSIAEMALAPSVAPSSNTAPPPGPVEVAPTVRTIASGARPSAPVTLGETPKPPAQPAISAVTPVLAKSASIPRPRGGPGRVKDTIGF